MAYEARKNDADKAQQDAQSDASNQKAAKAGLSALEKSGGWWGAAARVANKVDDATGGKVTELAGKGITKANKMAPGGKTAQKLTNKLADSKVANEAYDAYQAKNGKAGAAEKAKKGAEKAEEAKKKADQAKENKSKAEQAKKKKNEAKKGGGKDDSLPSSDADKDDKKSGIGGGIAFIGLAPIAISLAPLFLIVMFLTTIVTTTENTAEYQDAYGVSQVSGGDTGGMDGTVSDIDQESFYNRIVDEVKSKDVDDVPKYSLLVVAVYHSLNMHDANVSYNDMNNSKIKKIVDAMFDDGVYSEETFKTNIKNSIVPDYIKDASDAKKEEIANSVFEFVSNYYVLIGKEDDAGCSSDGVCTYDIKGFYINGTSYKKEMSVSNLYVRLMQCGVYNEHNAGGTWGKALEGEDLIPFEKYILGVAYQEIGPNAPEQAIKAQMVAARSYILARPTQMGSSTKWRSLSEENGKWVLQVASCTADQVYCDPDRGCSSLTGDAQWEQVYSGTNHGKKIKDPLPADSPLRRYVTDVGGETLVNKQGYVVLTGYTNKESNEFINLANKGLDYKQILVQVYSKKNSNVGSLDINKSKCDVCETTGEYAQWKQYSGEWASVEVGHSGNSIKQIGCLVTSLAIQVARSGVQTNISNFNPGTFVQALSKQGAFSSSGALNSYASVQNIAPRFKYENVISLSGKSKQEKLNIIKNIVNQNGVYAVAEVMGNTGQHWVAIEKVNGETISMFDPGSSATDMWKEYKYYNTSRIVYYRVS